MRWKYVDLGCRGVVDGVRFFYLENRKARKIGTLSSNASVPVSAAPHIPYQIHTIVLSTYSISIVLFLRCVGARSFVPRRLDDVEGGGCTKRRRSYKVVQCTTTGVELARTVLGEPPG